MESLRPLNDMPQGEMETIRVMLAILLGIKINIGFSHRGLSVLLMRDKVRDIKS